jgi:hypothetical protein
VLRILFLLRTYEPSSLEIPKTKFQIPTEGEKFQEKNSKSQSVQSTGEKCYQFKIPREKPQVPTGQFFPLHLASLLTT